MTLFQSYYRVVYIRLLRVIWYEGTVTTEIQYLGLKDGWMDGWTDGHRCLLYQIVLPELWKLVECIFSFRGFNVFLKDSNQWRR